MHCGLILMVKVSEYSEMLWTGGQLSTLVYFVGSMFTEVVFR